MSDHQYEAIEVPAVHPTKRPRGLLLDVASPIDLSPERPNGEGTRDFDPAERIVAGVQFQPDGCADLTIVEDEWCGDMDVSTTPLDAGECVGPFSSFWMEATEELPLPLPSGPAEARLKRRFNVRESAAMAARLLESPDSPDLVTSANQVLTSAVAVEEALYAADFLAADIAGNTGFMFLGSPGLFSRLVGEHPIEQDEAETGTDPNARPFRSPTGHIFVGDAGIDGTVPPDGQITPVGAEWLWGVTGVHYWMSSLRPLGTETARIDRTHNRTRVTLGRHGMVIFDTCAVIAFPVEVPVIEPVGS